MRPRVVEVTPGGNFGNIKEENYVQSRKGDQNAADLEKVELVQDLSLTPPNPLHLGHQIQRSTNAHVNSSKARTAMGEAQIFCCYCGDNFITLGSYAKHAASHASGEWKPEPDEDFDEREEIYLKTPMKCSGGAGAPVDLERRRVKQDSVSSSASFFTAQTHQASL